jgi:sRNA-binding carbon storage regulator CsrA
MERKWNAMYPTLSTGGNCIALSTVNGLGNWYQEVYYDAQANKNKWHVIELDFWEHPDYNDPKWVEDQRAQLSEDGWKQEVLRSFLGGGQTYIPPDIISDLDLQVRDCYPTRIKFPEWCNEKEDFFEERGALCIWREPIDGHEYILSVDAASGVGEKGDSSCFQVIDMAILEQVAEFYSNKIPPHIFAPIINEVGIYYNTALVVVENLAAEGGAVVAALKDTLIYENLYYDSKKRSSAGIRLNAQTRGLVLEALQQKLLQKQLIVNSPRFVHELKTFIFNASTKKPQAQRGKHDDAVMAMAMGLYVHTASMKDIPVGADVPKEMLNVFKTEVYEQIKKELKDGAPENWIEDEEDDLLEIYSDTVTPGVVFNLRRKYESLLREFNF